MSVESAIRMTGSSAGCGSAGRSILFCSLPCLARIEGANVITPATILQTSKRTMIDALSANMRLDKSGATRAARISYYISADEGFENFINRTACTQVIPNARLCKALLDRITDRAHILETGTESYRFRRTLDRQKKGAKTQ